MAIIFLAYLELNHVMYQDQFYGKSASVRDWYFEDEAFPESSDDGSLQIAFGVADFTNFLSPQKLTQIPVSVGKLEAYYRYRNATKDQLDEWQKLAFIPCSSAELGLEQNPD